MKAHRSTTAIALLGLATLLSLAGCASSSRRDFDAGVEENRMRIEEIDRIMDARVVECEGDPDCIAGVNDERFRLTVLSLERLIGDARVNWGLPQTPTETKPEF